LFIFLFLSCTSCVLNAQCPETPYVNLQTQDDVDAFLINYPNCTELYWQTMRIGINYDGTTDITNLDGLQNLTSINNLFITNNTSLQDLSGLSQLTEVISEFHILENTGLENLSGLSGLQTVGGDLEVDGNIGMTSLDLSSLESVSGHTFIFSNPDLITFGDMNSLESLGDYSTLGINSVNIQGNYALNDLGEMDNLTQVGDRLYIAWNLELQSLDALSNLSSVDLAIVYCASLDDLSGLSGLTSTERLVISNNESLSSLEGLNNIIEIEAGCLIGDNPVLSACSIYAICQMAAENPSELTVVNNATGCDNINEINGVCNSVSLNPMVFWDENMNGVMDPSESPMSLGQVEINPGELTIPVNSASNIPVYLTLADYHVNYIVPDNWALTTDSEYNVMFETVQQIETVYFGLHPTAEVSNMNTAITNRAPRCNEFVKFEAIGINEGSTITDGVLWLEINELITSVLFVDAPDYEEPNRYGVKWYSMM